MDLVDWWQDLPSHIGWFATHYGAAAYGVTALVLFIRTGILPGGAVPGGTMILAIGIVATSWPIAALPLVVAGLIIACSAGCAAGYWVARTASEHPNAPRWLRPSEALLTRTSRVYEKMGVAATAFAVSQPWACSVSPWVAVRAGLAHNSYAVGSILGSVLWVGTIFFLGYGGVLSISR